MTICVSKPLLAPEQFFRMHLLHFQYLYCLTLFGSSCFYLCFFLGLSTGLSICRIFPGYGSVSFPISCKACLVFNVILSFYKECLNCPKQTLPFLPSWLVAYFLRCLHPQFWIYHVFPDQQCPNPTSQVQMTTILFCQTVQSIFHPKYFLRVPMQNILDPILST